MTDSSSVVSSKAIKPTASPTSRVNEKSSYAVAPLTVGDLFCGAGGFSEGFRQAGYKVLWGIDNWQPAVDTHKKNHPEVDVRCADILKVNPHSLPKVDVLVGSPPCTFFSLSNRGGNGDPSRGLTLVKRFLMFVHVLKPKYWIMENVPQLLRHLPKRISLRKLGFDEDGYLEIPVRLEVNSADFGVPQRRRRVFCGSFPSLNPTHAKHPTGELRPWRTLGEVLEALPVPDTLANSSVSDPNYGFSIPAKDLTEQANPVSISKEDYEIIKAKKQRHSFYGFMAIPERNELPARTICAYQSGRGREAFLVWGGGWYRHLTVRECATLQSYPISYQFWGDRQQDRYTLVGNAVPPGMSRALALALLQDAGRRAPEKLRITTNVPHSPPPIIKTIKKANSTMRLPLTRRFRDHVPGCRQNSLRVDLDNEGVSRPQHPLTASISTFKPTKHLKRWQAQLHLGIGKGFRKQAVSSADAYRELTSIADADVLARANKLLHFLEKNLKAKIPDASTSQALWARHQNGVHETPPWILEQIGNALERTFPKADFEKCRLPKSGQIRIVPKAGLPIRLAAGLFAAAFVADVMNDGLSWIEANPTAFYFDESLKIRPRLSSGI
jgi:DNA (cytosine-5)-methyltransferase 1